MVYRKRDSLSIHSKVQIMLAYELVLCHGEFLKLFKLSKESLWNDRKSLSLFENG